MQFELTAMFDAANVIETDQKRDDSDHSKAAVDEPPIRRNSADGTGDQREMKNAQAGEGEPVGSIRHERVIAIGLNSPDGGAGVNLKM